MNKQELFKSKIKAFLHDPPQKPLVLGEGKGHESYSQDYIKILLGDTEKLDNNQWKNADHIASAADRTSFPLEAHRFKVDFKTDPIIVHPLSGKHHYLSKLSSVDTSLIQENVEEVIRNIKDKSENDYQKAFLLLWRSFTDLALGCEIGNDRIGHLFNYLPADTRIPDHSVLDHAQMVSAFATADIDKEGIKASFLLFQIGPVQEFIAAARKTADLWAGSYLLSWLSWQAMKVVCEEVGPDCILFPDLKGQPLVDYWMKFEKNIDIDFNEKNLKAPTLPNRFFAVLPSERVSEIAQKAEKAVRDAFKKAGDFAWSRLEEIFPDDFELPSEQSWDEQMDHFIQVYWVSTDLPNWLCGIENLEGKFSEKYGELFGRSNQAENASNPANPTTNTSPSSASKYEQRKKTLEAYESGGFKPNIGTLYGRFYEITEKAMGARKSLRNFSQESQSGYRCSLIPNLSAITPDRDHLAPGEYKHFWNLLFKQAQEKPDLRKLLGKNERLSAIAFTKRLFPTFLKDQGLKEVQFENIGFTSTHTFAVSDFKYQLLKSLSHDSEEVKKALNVFINSANCFQEYLTLNPEIPLYKLRRTAEKVSVDCKMGAFNLCSLPGELLQLDYYDGNYNSDLKAEEHATEPKILAVETRKALKDLIQKSALIPPSKYYAILYLDGDNMGKWLMGDNAPEIHETIHPKALKRLIEGIQKMDEETDENAKKTYSGWKKLFNNKESFEQLESIKRPQAPTQHLAISRALNNFSLHLVRPIVEEKYLGRLIYAGGDDVVAMVSLQDALSCAHDLRAAFSGLLESSKEKSIHELENVMGNPEKSESAKGFVFYKSSKKGSADPITLLSTMGKTASASCGIGVVHYMYPLKEALAEARKAQKFAKDKLNRDACAINIVKRSGETFISGDKWCLNSGGQKPFVLIEALRSFGDAIKKEILSPKFIVDVETEAPILDCLDLDDALKEIGRIFKQHCQNFGSTIMRNEGESDKDYKKRINEERHDFFAKTIGALFRCSSQQDNSRRISTATKLLDMAYFIGKGGGR